VKRPFFSILLPTKNRSEILGDAIESALQQTFQDFELIISDNDDSEVSTATVAARYADARVRYFRTSGKLPMYENWENALNQATGAHVLVLEDKMRLVLNALEILQKLIQEHGDVVISYDVRFAAGKSIAAPPSILEPRIYKCAAVARMFCRFSQRSFNLLPKGLDSCAPLETIQRVKQDSPTGYFFSYVTPDYSSAFQLLRTVDHLLFVREPLVYIPNNWMWQGKYSTGQDSYKKTESYARFLQSLPVDPEQVLRQVPIKSQYLWINYAIYDFEMLYRRPDHKVTIDWVRYHAFCVVIILMGWKVGGDMSQEILDLRDSLRQQSMLFKVGVACDFLLRVVQLIWQAIRNRLNRRVSPSVFL
jgi:glycosyltransferase involved in cell wall biosynthesis